MSSSSSSYQYHEAQAQEALNRLMEMQQQQGDASTFESPGGFAGEGGTRAQPYASPGAFSGSPRSAVATASFLRRPGAPGHTPATPRTLGRGNTLGASAYEGNQRPEEDTFHDVLEDYMPTLADAGVGMGEARRHMRAVDDADLATRVGVYLQRLTDLEAGGDGHGHGHGQQDASSLNTTGVFSSLRARGGLSTATGAADAKAERDLWKLVIHLTDQGLMRQAVEPVSHEVSVLSPNPIVTEPDEAMRRVLERALEERWPLKKGRALQAWLEDCAREGVDTTPCAVDIMKPVRIRNPDAQISKNGNLTPLDGAEGADQERLLLDIWQLVRCGEIDLACQRAYAEGYAWLASSIRGCAAPSFTVDGQDVDVFDQDQGHSGKDGSDMGMDVDGGGGVVGEGFGAGNVKRPLWLSTAWKYVERLRTGAAGADVGQQAGARGFKRGLGNVGRRGTGAGRLELAIYGALCNNTRALESSGQVLSWTDRVWSLVKASHDLDMTSQAASHRRSRHACSDLYPGCDQQTILREHEWMDWVHTAAAPVDLWTCEELFRREPPPGPMVNGPMNGAPGISVQQNALLLEPGSTQQDTPFPLQDLSAEHVLLCLQAAVMGGGDLLGRHIRSAYHHVVAPLQAELFKGTLSHASAFFVGYARVLRVYAHLALWLASAQETCQPLAASVLDASGTVLAGLVGAYAHHLLRRGQGSLVPTYAAALWSHEQAALRVPLGRGPLARASLDVAVALIVGHTMHTSEGITLTGEARQAREEAARRLSVLLRGALPPAAVLEVLVRAVRTLLYKVALPGLSPPSCGDAAASTGGRAASAASSSAVGSTAAIRRTPSSRMIGGASVSARTPVTSLGSGSSGSSDEWRLRALSWLCRPDEPEHRADCIKQANAYLFSVASEQAHLLGGADASGNAVDILASKTTGSFVAQLSTVVALCMPADSLPVAEAHCQAWLASCRTSGAVGDEVQAEVALALWAEQRRLRLWQSLQRAVVAVASWKETLARHRSLLQELDGSDGNAVVAEQMERVVPMLDQAATTVYEALHQVVSLEDNAVAPVNCVPGPCELTAGIAQVLGASERLLLKRCVRALSGELSGVDNSALGVDLTAEEPALGQGQEHEPELASAVEWESLQRDVRQTFLGTADASELQQLEERVAQLRSAGAGAPPNVRAAAVQRCQEALKELERDRNVVRSVSVLVVRAMSDVCLITAHAVEHVSPTTCAHWCKRAVQMASFVASENPETVLYKLISRGALTALLRDVQVASVKLLDLFKGSPEVGDAGFDVRISAGPVA
jgi:hypothetical protein